MLPESERVKKLSTATLIISIILVVVIIIAAFALQTPVVLVLILAVAVYFLKNKDLFNYCPHCYAPKDFEKSVCPHCGLDAYKSTSSQVDSKGNKKQQQGISCSGMLGAFLFIMVVIFIIIQISTR
jgi:rRNA maturation endonuclease Nob1